MAQPDSKKVFFENLSGAGKAIAVLTSGGDAQGKETASQALFTVWGMNQAPVRQDQEHTHSWRDAASHRHSIGSRGNVPEEPVC